MTAGLQPASNPGAAVVNRRRRLRVAVLALASLECALLGFYFAVMVSLALSSDPLGSAIGQGMASLTMIPLALFALPALVLGIVDRWLLLALLLIVLAVVVTPVLFVYA